VEGEPALLSSFSLDVVCAVQTNLTTETKTCNQQTRTATNLSGNPSFSLTFSAELLPLLLPTAGLTAQCQDNKRSVGLLEELMDSVSSQPVAMRESTGPIIHALRLLPARDKLRRRFVGVVGMLL
jgi:hypothetical protein